MTIEVLSPGLATTVQDLGRHCTRAMGIGLGGAADSYSLMIANLLVGNALGDAALEIALTGPALRLQRDATVAICGANIVASAGGVELPGWRPVVLKAGSTVALGACRHGARACVAVDGGIDVPMLLGSRSTDLRGGFGGHRGRALRSEEQV